MTRPIWNHKFFVPILLIAGALLVIPTIQQSRKANRELMAQIILRQISIAMENYMTFNQNYPTTTEALLTAKPPYLNKNFFEGEHSGFHFMSQLTPYSYSISAIPISAKIGIQSFTIETGGVFRKDQPKSD